jgi:hypothetical protein
LVPDGHDVERGVGEDHLKAERRRPEVVDGFHPGANVMFTVFAIFTSFLRNNWRFS